MPDLFGSAHWVLIMGIVGAIVTSQWHQEALPLIALVVVLALTVLKARLIILDFMRLRGSRPVLAAALLAWPVMFAFAVAVKAVAGI
ncbi:MAG: cytochrome C oxidase subunit IV family protein [Pararhizobium sp.]